ncbi:MAG: amino acid permease [Pseudomonadota bacterium]
MTASDAEQVGLQRRLTLPLLTFYGLGTIVGAGIYVLIGAVAGRAGIYAPIAFLMSALIAALTAHSYAALSARFPKSAGEAVYVREGLGSPLLAGMTGIAVIVTGVVSAATIANGFAGYLGVFVDYPSAPVIVVFVVVLCAVAIWGILESVLMATVITVLSLVGLLIAVYLASDSLSQLDGDWSKLVPPPELGAWTGITFGAFLAFYAFIGFEDMVNVAEEVQNPKQTLPVAIYLALILAALLYVLVALVAVLTLDVEVLARSEAPLVDVVAAAGSRDAAPLIGVLSLLSVTNSALAQIIMASRILYGMSRDGALPAWFASVSPRTKTPTRATLFTGAVVLLFALALPLVTLAEITSFIILAVFTLVNAAYFRLRLRADAGRRIVVTPLVAIALCLFLLVVQGSVRLIAG